MGKEKQLQEAVSDLLDPDGELTQKIEQIDCALARSPKNGKLVLKKARVLE